MNPWNHRTCFFLLALAGAWAAAGCGARSGSKVSGSVTLDGQPLAGAQVQFVPKADLNLGSHTTTTDSAGQFTLRADASNNPVKPGQYIVLISKLASPAGGGMGTMTNVVPQAYSNRSNPLLSADVKSGDTTLPPFELKTAETR